jgi:hypothetical protein
MVGFTKQQNITIHQQLDNALDLINTYMVTSNSTLHDRISKAYREINLRGKKTKGTTTQHKDEGDETTQQFENAFNKVLKMNEYNEYYTLLSTLDSVSKQTTELEKDYIYPSLNDPMFVEKIANKEEFYNSRYSKDNKSKPYEIKADEICSTFEIAPHQNFVRDFLSNYTPYNSLLLFHGLGTGKTCSSITVCEEMRSHMKQYGLNKKIIIIASPNVQQNFKTQLFDERKLKNINGKWNIQTCAGKNFIKDILSLNNQNVSKHIIIKEAKQIIRDHYRFMGYTEFANYIENIFKRTYGNGIMTERKRNEILQREFSNRLIVIDEVHNIRITGDVSNKRITQSLLQLVSQTTSLKLLLLSATPMFNDIREIVWLMNLMNANDKRSIYKPEDIFTVDGKIKKEVILDEGKKESGIDFLKRKLTGYVSFMRGENPYSFPLRIYPSLFDKEHTILSTSYKKPKIQLNGVPIKKHLQFSDIYLSTLQGVQRKGYKQLCKQLLRFIPSSDAIDKGIGWQKVDPLLQALNIVYPSATQHSEGDEDDEETRIVDTDNIGTSGLRNTMEYTHSNYKNFSYKDGVEHIFKQPSLKNYSHKINAVINQISKSKGVCIIYSQYIDGGCIPMALALEEAGYRRTNQTRSLFTEYNDETSVSDVLDVNTMKRFKDLNAEQKKAFKPAKYAMITGNKNISPNNSKELKMVTNTTNVYGDDVKVIIISRAGSEGIDFKYVRQMHILDPWYNMSRVEQIIGRAIRFCSHSLLPIQERNCEVYLHGTKSIKDAEELDMYIYRVAEQKAIEIGKITRLMKEISVDCYLNHSNSNIQLDIKQIHNDLKKNTGTGIRISTNKEITFPSRKSSIYPAHSTICDYMESCEFSCNMNMKDLYKEKSERTIQTNKTTYSLDVIEKTLPQVIDNIVELFRKQYVYTIEDIYSQINKKNNYSNDVLQLALKTIHNNKSILVIDKLGRTGYVLVNKNIVWFISNDMNAKYPHYDIDEIQRQLPVFLTKQTITNIPNKDAEKTAMIKQTFMDKTVKDGKDDKDDKDSSVTAVTQYDKLDIVDESYNKHNIMLNKMIEPHIKELILNEPIENRNSKWGMYLVIASLKHLFENIYYNRGVIPITGANISLGIDKRNKLELYRIKQGKEIIPIDDLIFMNLNTLIGNNLRKNFDIINHYQYLITGTHTINLQTVVGADIFWYECILQLNRYNKKAPVTKEQEDAGLMKTLTPKWYDWNIKQIFNERNILKYIIQHFMDSLTTTYKMELIKQLHNSNKTSVFNLSKDDTMNFIITTMREYVKTYYYLGDYTSPSGSVDEGYILSSKNKYDIFVLDTTILDFVDVTPIHKIYFDNKIEGIKQKITTNYDKYKKEQSLSTGFLSYVVKDKTYVYKYKALKNVRDTGVICRNQNTKILVNHVNDIISYIEGDDTKQYIIETTVDDSKPNNIKYLGKKRHNLCVEAEFMMRYLQEKHSKSGLWYVIPEYVKLIGIQDRKIKIKGKK